MFKIKTEPISYDSSVCQKIEDSGDIVQPAKIQTSDQATFPREMSHNLIAETTPLTSARESVAETTPLASTRESVVETTPLTSARESVNKSVESSIDTLSAGINRSDKLHEKVHSKLTEYEDFDGSCFGDPSLQDIPLHSKSKVKRPRSLQILENAAKVKTKKTVNKRFRRDERQT